MPAGLGALRTGRLLKCSRLASSAPAAIGPFQFKNKASHSPIHAFEAGDGRMAGRGDPLPVVFCRDGMPFVQRLRYERWLLDAKGRRPLKKNK